MTKYGYVSGWLKDNVIKQDSFEYQAKILLNMGIPYNHCFADVFRQNNKERYQLFKFLTTVAQEGDVLVVPTLTCLYSNIRELCCLMYIVENTGIIIQSSDMDLSSDSDSSDWIIASQLAHLDYLHYLRQKHASKLIKKNKYKSSLNVGGRNKRVITPLYRQAYNYLQEHTYNEAQHKFNLSKSTLYRIKRQINDKKQPINTHQSYDSNRGDYNER
ncbi:recombinase family protein [Limosilactobacillus reuteri]|uniref:Recombinase family protein n=1 Tax=Limosilactobacillus reuteri TaxID=1598 RepID=A0AAW4X7X1_LIMRT|nr:recombinase family protein [Limosilactobacillus reuteri]MCC4478519.1 recombinase family protein [Limosilactobacillus reuteri]MCC4480427.1 recombinase family protein [Limosilactobacillus reuteri]MCC4498492.1 recombinase family protein [Limosilactobacillus reuteri]PEG79246.1 resolvase [Lactobacillus sp. UMNPBX18]